MTIIEQVSAEPGRAAADAAAAEHAAEWERFCQWQEADQHWDDNAHDPGWVAAMTTAEQQSVPRHAIEHHTRTLTDLEPAADPAEQINRIAALEQLIAAAHGAMAAEEVAFAHQQRAQQIRDRVPARHLGRGIAEHIGFARRISPVAAAHHLGYAHALHTRMPNVYQQLRAGHISEAQARIVITRTSHLSDLDATLVDAGIAARLPGWNLAATEQAANHASYAIDPHGHLERKARAEADRRVWIRPAPDSMTIVSALLPTAQGVAVYAALKRAADTAATSPDTVIRGTGQVKADTLVERCTGQSTADAVPIEIRLTMTADTLLAGGHTPGHLDAYGPLPAEICRDLALDTPARTWIRRIFTDPVTDEALQVDARRRLFPTKLRRLIAIRDRTCRQPFCTAPIRHTDHIQPWAHGGPTTPDNGQGLCVRGNQLKDLPGWHTRRTSDGSTTITTPTGHRYTTSPPPQIGLPAFTRRR